MEGEVVGGGNYIKIKNHGTRKIRHYKNGKKYIIINGKKKKNINKIEISAIREITKFVGISFPDIDYPFHKYKQNYK